MMNQWEPSRWGRLLTQCQPWRLNAIEDGLALTTAGGRQEIPIQQASPMRAKRGLFWTTLSFGAGDLQNVQLKGLPHRHAAEVEAFIAGVLATQRLRARQDTFDAALRQIRGWLELVARHTQLSRTERRWITQEQQQALLDKRPALALSDQHLHELLDDPDIQAGPAQDQTKNRQDISEWNANWTTVWARENEAHLQRELRDHKDLFDTVESQPLTEEQARAVICFDNRVLVIASAGSGKTSTMVAKAAYAIRRALVPAERILLLAFNAKAAEELAVRSERAFKRIGLQDTAVDARTFHALGRRIIGKATGRMPDLPVWAVETAEGLQQIAGMVDRLKDRSPQFRTAWDLFRLVFGRDLPGFGAETPAEEWDRHGVGYVRTLNGERVRSREECVIADWLFYNGVNYQYEPPYEFDTATDEYRQYRPDFYYPDIQLYHEHLALNGRGEPPAHFARYLESLAWKRQEHQRRGTALVETTSHQLRSGELFAHLSRALTARGLVLDPNPDRPIPAQGQPPMAAADLVALVRTFISHAKSNCLTPKLLHERLDAMPEDDFRFRHRMFLTIAIPIMEAWDAALAAEDGIDFEDMLNQAAEHLETGRYVPEYDLVMADEFQDASRARARLCRALVRQPGRHFFAVGDDWQSINRFAGADLSVMTGFRDWFGPSAVLKLEQTFRCPQALCDASSRFITRNPNQLPKGVRSATAAHGPVLQALQVSHKDETQGAIDAYLSRLFDGVREGTIPQGRNGRVSVFILGRYKADRAFVPSLWRSRYGARIDLEFLTVHRSKGAEADYIVLPAMVRRGFPNLRADDPVLALAMPAGDTFALSEERRLFYVALTRARRSVALFTVRGQVSSFLDELVQDHAVAVTNTEGESIHEHRCPICKVGVIITRPGRYGEFQACSAYPRCEYKPPQARSFHGKKSTIRRTRPNLR
ncbi:UvrD-helicase domain-containing protein [Cupriavidus sp. P-10]|uniref:UvrD-helicase domain-containing protein n=1 Tax=Cupriavidus sp. P-10 TaxID=2027911 RepID=UPI000E2F9EE3|nr:UvrD-helicase domain-containing protein [Cupriavidus sp. P-10]BDB27300.1 UvrD-helicase domain-containing protein [Cupriavidus sp. P-10]